MARPRRVPGTGSQLKVTIVSTKSSSGGSSGSSPTRIPQHPRIFSWRGAIGVACLAVAVYYGALGYLETRVNTPFDDEKVVKSSGLEVPDRFWNTYRSGHYLGLRARYPKSPLFGLMWYDQSKLARNQAGIRHWCDQGDGLATYGWLRHDGSSFGEQLLVDTSNRLKTSFVKTQGGKNGGGWTVRVDVESENTTNPSGPISLVWYVALDETLGTDGRMWLDQDNTVSGNDDILGRYKAKISINKDKDVRWSQTETRAPGVHLLKEKLMELLRVVRRDNGNEIVLVHDDELQGEWPNFIAVQATVRPPFSLEVVFETEGSARLSGDEYARALADRRRDFDERFERTFQLAEKGYEEVDIAIARAALSNMVGGISYMYGAGRVRSQHTKEPVPYWRAPLYTAVPSRSFFPRGFLWDEGFHGLLIGRWSPEIQLDIASHWFDLLNVEGWIPREQILGLEAAARVPKEFIVQDNAAANPPMFLLQLGWLVKSRPQLFRSGPHRETLMRMFPRLQVWYQWFHTTQKGPEQSSYRWRGRENGDLELNPKTLTSGLDDYPRASHPSNAERHVDLRCWMYAAADAMATIAATLDRDTTKYEDTRDLLGDEKLLNELHWSEKAQMYADYGLHTDDIKLVRAQRSPQDPAPPQMVRRVGSPPRLQLVTSALGYISLFPMLLRVLNPESPKLVKILEDLDNPDHMWSPYGLRSLSKSSPFFMRRNTEHDPPYWRGQVWLNINYLALSALRHYAASGGHSAARARQLHANLKHNIVETILRQYKATGYLWEQYSSEDGRGSGCRPFTGWTALVVNIMSDQY